MDSATPFAGKHGVEPFQEFRVVVEAVLQILGYGHPVFAVVGHKVDVNPSAKLGLSGGNFLLRDGHKPSLVAGGEESTVPGDGVIHSGDVSPCLVCANGVRDLCGYGNEVPCRFHFETLHLR